MWNGIGCWRGVLAVALTGCAAAQVPHRIADRDVEVTDLVRITHLPPASRLTIETPRGRETVATNVEGTVEFPFSFPAREHVDNGVATRTSDAATVTLWIQAPSYLPREVMLHLPAESEVDGSLTQPRLTPLAVSDEALADANRGLERVLSGRCAEASAYLTTAAAHAASRHERSRIERIATHCHELSVLETSESSWDPNEIGIPTELTSSPPAAISALEALMVSESDAAGREGLRRLVEDVVEGRLIEASRLATLVAAPLPARRAALVLRLPVGLLAVQRMQKARALLTQGDSRASLLLAAEARRLDPFAEPQVYSHIVAARGAALISHADDAIRAGAPLLARAYLRAARALEPSAARARDALTRTQSAASGAVALHLAIVPSGAGPDVMRDVIAALPPHVIITDSTNDAEAIMSLYVGEPVREHRVTQASRTKRVTIGHVTRPNDDYAAAEAELAQARQEVAEADDAQQKMHAQAIETAKAAAGSGGLAAVVGGVLSTATEGGGVAIAISAHNRLRTAQARLSRTPRTRSEAVTRDASYPVLQLTTTATAHIELHIDGLADTIDEQTDASAHATSEQVIGSADIGVSDSSADVSAHAQLSPDVHTSATELATRMRTRLQSLELQQAWDGFVAQRERGDITAAATAADAYLELAGDADGHEDELTRFFLEALP